MIRLIPKMKRICSQLCGRVEISNLYKCIFVYSYTLTCTKENKQDNIKNRKARKGYCYKIKMVKQSRYRPGVAQRVPES
jgi:hypothetical protein